MRNNMEEIKYKKLFSILGRWVSLNESGLTVGNYLAGKNKKNIAIYGLGVLGKHLLYELKEAGINVTYGIDKRGDKLNLDISFIDWEEKDNFPEVDFLIVTAIVDYEILEKELCEIREYPMISLEEIICDMEQYRRKLNG